MVVGRQYIVLHHGIMLISRTNRHHPTSPLRPDLSILYFRFYPKAMADCWKVNVPLAESDPEVHDIILAEKERQRSGLEMIASENLTSLPVLECMGSCLHNKYSEGQPGQRYYGGNQFIDQVRLVEVGEVEVSL